MRVPPDQFDEYFRESVARPVVRLEYTAACGVHLGVALSPDPPEETVAPDGSRSVRVACPEPGCGVSAVLTLRRAAPASKEESA